MGVPARGFIVTDRLRYLAWLLVFLAGILLYVIESVLLTYGSGWIEWALIPLWLVGVVGFLSWSQSFLLHGRISWQDALPGALLAAVGLLGLRAFSSIFLTEWLNWYSKSYGGIGIVMAIFFWIALLTAILLASASRSPAYAVRAGGPDQSPGVGGPERSRRDAARLTTTPPPRARPARARARVRGPSCPRLTPPVLFRRSERSCRAHPGPVPRSRRPDRRPRG